MGYWGKHHTEEYQQTMSEVEDFDDKGETIDWGDHNILAVKRTALFSNNLLRGSLNT